MSGAVQARLAELGLTLPPPFQPVATYVGAVATGGQVWISGMGPTWDTEIRYRGKVGRDLDLAAGQAAARLTALNLISHLERALDGDLDRVRRCVKVFGLVNCAPDFAAAHRVIDAASAVLIDVFGAPHARSITTAPGLPFQIAVELDAVFEVA